MKCLSACLLLLGLAAAALAEGPTLREARQRWLRGHYDEARAAYEELARDAKNKEAAVLGLSRTWQSQGEYDKALAVVEAALRDSTRAAGLLARRAELLYLRGRWDEAEKAANQALDVQKDSFPARWILAQAERDRGDMKKADGEFRWFVRTYTQRSDNDNDIKDPDELLLVGLAGSENARWNNLPDQFQFILNEVYGDALKSDKDFWPAEYEAGMLLLEKYNRGEALAAFDKALVINPNAAEALVGKGMAALQTYEIRSAEQFAERALKINPHLPAALNLRADVHLAGGSVAKALRVLEEARKVNPRDENTLGRIAACLYLRHQNDDLQKLIKEVEKQDARAGLFYETLAEQLEERRRFEDAEKYYKKSIELRPVVPWSQNSLGLLYMRLGREKEARDILTRSFEADSFNVRVSNTLKVLRHLDRYETLKTPHFELRFDPQRDRLLAKYMAGYLEGIYTQLSDQFHCQPAGPILVEVFNNHEMFSGRTIALPDLHTIGACTGRMVAMVSPRGRGVRRPFNWARVLRHELVHIFNLEQSHFQVPHWLTEGLAVSNEGFPRPQAWNELLLERVPVGDLMNLDDIDLGFIRPRDPEDWHMAYCQSQLYVQYLKEKYGPQAIGDLLAAYRDDLDTGEAIARACKVNKEKFEKGYESYLKGVVKGLRNRPPEQSMKFSELKEAHEKEPGNAVVTARLAVQYLNRNQRAEARQLAEAALGQVKAQPLASYVKARLLQAAGDDQEARKLLEAALDPRSPEPKVLELLGRLYFESKDFAKAAHVYEVGHQAEPYESRWLTELAKVYNETKEKEKLIHVLEELAPTDADELDARKQLAQLLIEARRYPDAEKYARQALEIDVLDAETQKALGDALLGQEHAVAAIEAYQTALQIDDKSDDARLGLARAYLAKGDLQKAEAEIDKVLARDPNNPEAKRLREPLSR